jgi:hypothetical protein
VRLGSKPSQATTSGPAGSAPVGLRVAFSVLNA